MKMKLVDNNHHACLTAEKSFICDTYDEVILWELNQKNECNFLSFAYEKC